MPTAIQLKRNHLSDYSSEHAGDKGGGSNQFTLPVRQWIFGIYRNGDSSDSPAADLPDAYVFRIVGNFVRAVGPKWIIEWRRPELLHFVVKQCGRHRRLPVIHIDADGEGKH